MLYSKSEKSRIINHYEKKRHVKKKKMSTVHPAYVVKKETGSDRLSYIPTCTWPDPSRRALRVVLKSDAFVVNFDDRGRPCDIQHHLSQQARQKIRSRRQTPRGEALPDDEVSMK